MQMPDTVPEFAAAAAYALREGDENLIDDLRAHLSDWLVGDTTQEHLGELLDAVEEAIDLART